MKKIIALIMAISVVTAAFAGCNNNDSKTDATTTAAETTVAETTVAETTVA